MLFGLVLGAICVIVAMGMEGGNFSDFLSFPAFLVVIGGSLGATMISFRISQLLAFWRIWRTVQDLTRRKDEMTTRLARYAGIVRHHGVLKLDSEVSKEQDHLLRVGLTQLVEGDSPEEAMAAVERCIQIELQQLSVGERFFEAAGGYCPTFGIIGTVMGLVAVLSDLSQPEKLAHGIAAAFVATFYGVLFANMFILPMASRIREQSQEYSEFLDNVYVGMRMVHRGESPLRLAERLGGPSPKLDKSKDKVEGNTRAIKSERGRNRSFLARVASTV